MLTFERSNNISGTGKQCLLKDLMPKKNKKKNFLNRREHRKNKMADVSRFGLVDYTLSLS
jgi:hypothetical protein